jgi:benzoyl-CoA reductase subunit BamB
MRYSGTGYNLEIDLSRGSIERVETDPRDTELFLGGLGTNAKIFWDRVPPETEPFSPDNLLIFGAGLLCGTPALAANHTCVTTLSPLTELLAFSNMGGFWAPELKYAGYEKVIIRGKSPDLVYLWIHNDKVEIRDASHLKGMGSLQTQTFIKQELNEPKTQVISIGMAGENRVYFATIEHDSSSASRGGLGAIMGDKNLKAIAVRGTTDINIARPAEFMDLRREVWEYTKFRMENPIPETMTINERLGCPQEMVVDDEKWHTIMASWGNSRLRITDFWTPEIEKEWTETMKSMQVRLIGCYNCPLKCKASISPPGQPTYMMKCYSKMTWLHGAYSPSLDFGLRIAQRAFAYGMDSISTPQVMAFAFELLEAGILTDKDFPGMPPAGEARPGTSLPPNNEERFYYLLDKIARREGIGDILADGTYRAARKIDKGAEKYEHNTIKKQEQLPIKLGVLDPLYFLMFATGEKVNITQIQGQYPQEPFRKRETREEFVKDWFQVPDEKLKQYFVDWHASKEEGPNRKPFYPTPKMACEIVDWMERMHYVDDSLGLCGGLSSWNKKPPYHLHNLPKIISAATGMDYDTDKLVQTTRRIRTLLRAINVRRGLRRKDDTPPEDHWSKRFPELEKELIDEFYKLKGWDKDSIPTKESLHELGLDYVYRDFIERGIVTDKGSTPDKKVA